MIELRSVNKAYGERGAVKNLSLSFAEGKTTALIGPSGCGKSTILRLVLGLVRPTSGEVCFAGQPVRPDTEQSIRRSIGYVVQEGGLFPHLTAEDNVALMARHLGRGESEIQARIQELLKLVDLPPNVLPRYPIQLSGGQRQRIGLMRALMLQPKALLLDEPLGALDPMVRAGLQTDLKKIFADLGQTVVLVTHDMGEAAYLADQIVLMREGEIVQQGTLQDFQQRPANSFVTEFMSAQRGLVAL